MPLAQRRAVFLQVHQLSHAGRRATRRLLAAHFVWPGLAADVVNWCKECDACNRAKVTKQPTTSVEKMAIPGARFSHVHVDIVGPLPPSRDGYTHLLTIIDRSTRWPEAVLLRETTAEVVMDAFVATRDGWPALACRPSSLPTEGCSSPLPRGLTSAENTGCSITLQRPSTLRAMAWWKDSTGR